MTDVGLAHRSATASASVAPRGHGVLRRLLRHRCLLIGFVGDPADDAGRRARAADRADRSVPRCACASVSVRRGRNSSFGTDNFGRDVFSRVRLRRAAVARASASPCVVTAVVCSAIIGVVAGYFRALDGALMRVMDALMAFPAILLAIGHHRRARARACSASSSRWRSSTSRAPRASCAPRRWWCAKWSTCTPRARRRAATLRIMLRHILPNCLGAADRPG